MIRWLRVVIPLEWLAGTALMLAALEGLLLVVEWSYRFPFLSLGRYLTVPLLIILVVLYSVYRVWTFHPVLRLGYSQWLCTTPWTSAQPLPLGPIHVVLQDAVVLAVVVGLAWPHRHWGSLEIVQVFLCVYLGALGLATCLSGQKLWAYAMGFGVGLMVYFWSQEWFWAAAAATYGIAYLGLRQSLARFPWDDSATQQRWKEFLGRLVSGNKNQLYDLTALGWPCDRLGPLTSGTGKISLSDTLIIGLLVGWGSFVANTSGHVLGYGVLLVLLAYAVVIRLYIYCNGHVPPLSVMGRLAHGRLLIPGYDQVFVAPFLAMGVGVAALYFPGWTGMDTKLVIPGAFTFSLWILMGMGPGLRAWRLTGNHRIVAGAMNYPKTG